VQVKNSASSLSNIVNYDVIAPNPVPTLSSLSPSSGVVGAAGFTLTVNGASFVPGATVLWNGGVRTTSFVGAGKLTAAIAASDIASAGTYPVSVTNPAPGGGTSSSLDFVVATPNPAPTITSLNPTSAVAGSPALSVTITGTGFIPTSTANWNGSARTTTYQSATQLLADITMSDLITAGTDMLTVTNPAPGGGTSSGFTFSVIAPNPVPVLSSLSPTSATVGDPGFTLTLNGSGFVASSVASWNGVAKITAYVSPTQITIAVSGADVASAGVFPVVVDSPSPGGGTSTSLDFPVRNPKPSITSISPSTVTVGSGAFSLTVDGSGFVSSSVVQVDGSARTTYFVTANQLTADLPAGDDAIVTGHTISVVNPTPGGGTSTGVTLTVASQPNPVPTITTLSPCGKVAGSGSFSLTINGTDFVPTATATFNGAALAVNYVSATQLTATVGAAAIATAPSNDAMPVIVTNPAPGGGSSNTAYFGVASQSSTLGSNVQPIFTASCATVMCHVTGGTAPMSLESGKAFASLVGVASAAVGCSPSLRVLECGPLRSQSVLADKILATTVSPPCAGTAMPKGMPLAAAKQKLIIDWIAQGAPP
jgi:hypothetical protein